MGARRRRRLLDRQSDIEGIRDLTWQDSELLVGEAYRRKEAWLLECLALAQHALPAEAHDLLSEFLPPAAAKTAAVCAGTFSSALTRAGLNIRVRARRSRATCVTARRLWRLSLRRWLQSAYQGAPARPDPAASAH